MEEHGGKFPPLLINARMKIKKEKKGGNIKEKGGGRSNRGRKEKKRRKGRIFSAVRRSKLDNPRIKFHLHDERFAWVRESRVFAKLQEVGDFQIIYSLKSI